MSKGRGKEDVREIRGGKGRERVKMENWKRKGESERKGEGEREKEGKGRD